MRASPRHILICGPTASGKSALALALAERTGARIVNADALQVYRDWRVLTARPGPEEEARAGHLLYGHVAFDHWYSVGDWLREVRGLLASGPLIFVGGTGLYLTALTEGLADIPASSAEVRQRGTALLEAKGIGVFRDYLAARDPDYLAIVDVNNPMRLQRAWEVHEMTGRPMSWWRAQPREPLVELPDAVALSLVSDPGWLAARIQARFEEMIGMGVLSEVARVMPMWQPGLPATRALGAAELRAHLMGEISLDEAVERAKIVTRRFAKRQRTWFRSNMGDWRQVGWDGSQMEALVAELAG